MGSWEPTEPMLTEPLHLIVHQTSHDICFGEIEEIMFQENNDLIFDNTFFCKEVLEIELMLDNFRNQC